MDYTQQLKVPAPQGATNRQSLLIKIAVGGGVLAILILLLGMLSGGKTSQPQMIEALDSQYQLITAAELVRDYQISPGLQNIAVSIESTASSSYKALLTVSNDVYSEFEFKPSFNPAQVEESLQAAQQQNNTDEQARTILVNAITVLVNDLNELRAASANEQIISAVEANQTNLKAFQAQLSDN